MEWIEDDGRENPLACRAPIDQKFLEWKDIGKFKMEEKLVEQVEKCSAIEASLAESEAVLLFSFTPIIHLSIGRNFFQFQ